MNQILEYPEFELIAISLFRAVYVNHEGRVVTDPTTAGVARISPETASKIVHEIYQQRLEIERLRRKERQMKSTKVKTTKKKAVAKKAKATKPKIALQSAKRAKAKTVRSPRAI